MSEDKTITQRIQAGVASIAALGAVKRRGIGALQAYGGGIEGKGHIIHKEDVVVDGEVVAKAGSKTEFVMEGTPGPRPGNDRRPTA